MGWCSPYILDTFILWLEKKETVTLTVMSLLIDDGTKRNEWVWWKTAWNELYSQKTKLDGRCQLSRWGIRPLGLGSSCQAAVETWACRVSCVSMCASPVCGRSRWNKRAVKAHHVSSPLLTSLHSSLLPHFPYTLADSDCVGTLRQWWSPWGHLDTLLGSDYFLCSLVSLLIELSTSPIR